MELNALFGGIGIIISVILVIIVVVLIAMFIGRIWHIIAAIGIGIGLGLVFGWIVSLCCEGVTLSGAQWTWGIIGAIVGIIICIKYAD